MTSNAVTKNFGSIGKSPKVLSGPVHSFVSMDVQLYGLGVDVRMRTWVWVCTAIHIDKGFVQLGIVEDVVAHSVEHHVRQQTGKP